MPENTTRTTSLQYSSEEDQIAQKWFPGQAGKMHGHYDTEGAVRHEAESADVDHSFGAQYMSVIKHSDKIGMSVDEVKEKPAQAIARGNTYEVGYLGYRMYRHLRESNVDMQAARTQAWTFMNNTMKALGGYHPDATEKEKEDFYLAAGQLSYTNSKLEGGTLSPDGTFIQTPLDQGIDAGNKAGAIAQRIFGGTLAGSAIALGAKSLMQGGFEEGRTAMAMVRENAMQGSHRVIGDTEGKIYDLLGVVANLGEFVGFSAISGGAAVANAARAGKVLRAATSPSKAMLWFIGARGTMDDVIYGAGSSRKYFMGNKDQVARRAEWLASRYFDALTYQTAMRWTGPQVGKYVFGKLGSAKKAHIMGLEPLISTAADTIADVALDYGFHNMGNMLFSPMGIEFTATQMRQFGDFRNAGHDIVLRAGMRIGHGFTSRILHQDSRIKNTDMTSDPKWWRDRMNITNAWASGLYAKMHQYLPSHLADVIKTHNVEQHSLGGPGGDFATMFKEGKLDKRYFATMYLMKERINNTYLDELLDEENRTIPGKLVDMFTLKGKGLASVLYPELRQNDIQYVPGQVIRVGERLMKERFVLNESLNSDGSKEFWRAVVDQVDTTADPKEQERQAKLLHTVLNMFVRQATGSDAVKLRASHTREVARQRFGDDNYDGLLNVILTGSVKAQQTNNVSLETGSKGEISRMLERIVSQAGDTNGAFLRSFDSIDRNSAEDIQAISQGAKDVLKKRADVDRQEMSSNDRDFFDKYFNLAGRLVDEGLLKNPDEVADVKEEFIEIGGKYLNRMIDDLQKYIGLNEKHGVTEDMKLIRIAEDIKTVLNVQSTLGYRIDDAATDGAIGAEANVLAFFQNNRALMDRVDWNKVITGEDKEMYIRHVQQAGKSVGPEGIAMIEDFICAHPMHVKQQSTKLTNVLLGRNVGDAPIEVLYDAVRTMPKRIVVENLFATLPGFGAGRMSYGSGFEGIKINDEDAALRTEDADWLEDLVVQMITNPDQFTRKTGAVSKLKAAATNTNLSKALALAVKKSISILRYEGGNVSISEVKDDLRSQQLMGRHGFIDDIEYDRASGDFRIVVEQELTGRALEVAGVAEAVMRRIANPLEATYREESFDLFDVYKSKNYIVKGNKHTLTGVIDLIKHTEIGWDSVKGLTVTANIAGKKGVAVAAIKRYMEKHHYDIVKKWDDDTKTIFAKSFLGTVVNVNRAQSSYVITNKGKRTERGINYAPIKFATVVNSREYNGYAVDEVELPGHGKTTIDEIADIGKMFDDANILVLGTAGVSGTLHTVRARKIAGDEAGHTSLDEAEYMVDNLRAAAEDFESRGSRTGMAVRDALDNKQVAETMQKKAQEGGIEAAFKYFLNGDKDTGWDGLLDTIVKSYAREKTERFGDISDALLRIHKDLDFETLDTGSQAFANFAESQRHRAVEYIERLVPVLEDATVDVMDRLQIFIDTYTAPHAPLIGNNPLKIAQDALAAAQKDQDFSAAEQKLMDAFSEARAEVENIHGHYEAAKLTGAEEARVIDSYKLFLAQDKIESEYASMFPEGDVKPIFAQYKAIEEVLTALKKEKKSYRDAKDVKKLRRAMYMWMTYGERFLTEPESSFPKRGNAFKGGGAFTRMVTKNGAKTSKLIEPLDMAIRESYSEGNKVRVVFVEAPKVGGIAVADGIMGLPLFMWKALARMNYGLTEGTKLAWSTPSDFIKMNGVSSRFFDNSLRKTATVTGDKTLQTDEFRIDDNTLVITTDDVKVYAEGLMKALGVSEEVVSQMTAEGSGVAGAQSISRVFESADQFAEFFKNFTTHAPSYSAAQETTYSKQIFNNDPTLEAIGRHIVDTQTEGIRNNISRVMLGDDLNLYANEMASALRRPMRGVGAYAKLIPMAAAGNFRADRLDFELVHDSIIAKSGQYQDYSPYQANISLHLIAEHANLIYNKTRDVKLKGMIEKIEALIGKESGYTDVDQRMLGGVLQGTDTKDGLLDILAKNDIIEKHNVNGTPVYFATITRYPNTVLGQTSPVMITGIRGPWTHNGIEMQTKMVDYILGGDYDGDNVQLIPMKKGQWGEIFGTGFKDDFLGGALLRWKEAFRVRQITGQLGFKYDGEVDRTLEHTFAMSGAAGRTIAGIRIGSAFAHQFVGMPVTQGYTKLSGEKSAEDTYAAIIEKHLNLPKANEGSTERNYFTMKGMKIGHNPLNFVLFDQNMNVKGAWDMNMSAISSARDQHDYRLIQANLAGDSIAWVLLKSDSSDIGYKQIGIAKVPKALASNDVNQMMSRLLPNLRSTTAGKDDFERFSKSFVTIASLAKNPESVIIKETPNTRVAALGSLKDQFQSAGINVKARGLERVVQIIDRAYRDFDSSTRLTDGVTDIMLKTYIGANFTISDVAEGRDLGYVTSMTKINTANEGEKRATYEALANHGPEMINKMINDIKAGKGSTNVLSLKEVQKLLRPFGNSAVDKKAFIEGYMVAMDHPDLLNDNSRAFSMDIYHALKSYKLAQERIENDLMHTHLKHYVNLNGAGDQYQNLRLLQQVPEKFNGEDEKPYDPHAAAFEANQLNRLVENLFSLTNTRRDQNTYHDLLTNMYIALEPEISDVTLSQAAHLHNKNLGGTPFTAGEFKAELNTLGVVLDEKAILPDEEAVFRIITTAKEESRSEGDYARTSAVKDAFAGKNSFTRQRTVMNDRDGNYMTVEKLFSEMRKQLWPDEAGGVSEALARKKKAMYTVMINLMDERIKSLFYLRSRGVDKKYLTAAGASIGRGVTEKMEIKTLIALTEILMKNKAGGLVFDADNLSGDIANKIGAIKNIILQQTLKCKK